jgi:glycosyltransferase involved in cell wall biosynthesis
MDSVPKIKYSIIIPTSTNVDGLSKLLTSIIEHTDLSDKEIIVVVNTDDHTLYGNDHSAEIYNLIFLKFPTQLGYGRAVNEGIKKSKGEYIILLNDDCLLLNQEKNAWVEMLYAPFEPELGVGVTCPLTSHSKELNFDYAIFFCSMISKRLIDKIGMLDESFGSYYEDLDFCMRAKAIGVKTIQVCSTRREDGKEFFTGNFPIFHEGGKTHKAIDDIDNKIQANYKKAVDKHSGLEPKTMIPPIRIKPRHLSNLSKKCYIACSQDDVDKGRCDCYNEENRFAPHLPFSLNIEKAKTINGFMLNAELEWLAKRAKQTKVFVELGSWFGRSSRAIGDNLPEGSVLYCVDTWDGSVGEDILTSQASKQGGDHAFMQFIENNFDLIEAHKIVPLRMSGENAFQVLRNIKPDTIFIDADHSYEGVKKDIEMALKIIKPGGVICGHDFTDDWQGVKQAVKERFGDGSESLRVFDVASQTSIWHIQIELDSKGKIRTHTHNLDYIYTGLCNTPSDINEHLPTLKKYAEQCEHITEMGVRWVVSTYAFMMANPTKLISYDIHHHPAIEKAKQVAKENSIDFTFNQANVLSIGIEETDLLFIDTLHNYGQLKEELRLHARKVRKYIIFHDTISFGHKDEVVIDHLAEYVDSEKLWRKAGLILAIQEFLESERGWRLKEVCTNNNGLTVIERIN